MFQWQQFAPIRRHLQREKKVLKYLGIARTMVNKATVTYHTYNRNGLQLFNCHIVFHVTFTLSTCRYYVIVAKAKSVIYSFPFNYHHNIFFMRVFQHSTHRISHNHTHTHTCIRYAYLDSTILYHSNESNVRCVHSDTFGIAKQLANASEVESDDKINMTRCLLFQHCCLFSVPWIIKSYLF